VLFIFLFVNIFWGPFSAVVSAVFEVFTGMSR